MKHNEQTMIRLIKEEYSNRIQQVYTEAQKDLLEADMFDELGNQLLSPGLKVRHKKSGYEYTVDHVEGKDDSAVVSNQCHACGFEVGIGSSICIVCGNTLS